MYSWMYAKSGVSLPRHAMTARRSSPGSPHSSQSQYHLLSYACLLVATIEPGRKISVPGCVLRHIGVHQIDVDPPNPHLPDLHIDWCAAQRHLKDQPVPACIEHRMKRYLVKVQRVIDRLLPAIGWDMLPEIALRIDESHANKGQA